MKRFWKWLWSSLVEVVGVEEEPYPNKASVKSYGGYAICLTEGYSDSGRIYGATACNSQQAHAMTDGGPTDGPPAITVSGYESPGQAFEAMRMEIDAVSRVAEGE